MKSTPKQLQQRGYLSNEDFNSKFNNDSFDYEQNLHNQDPTIRTAAVRRIRHLNKLEYIPLLCDLLKQEKKLYTKIEICECLSNFREASVDFLIPLIGKIGSNQHKKIGNYDLKKKTYPLPRDIAARTMVRIGPAVFDKIKAELEKANDQTIISEMIDIIGHITYHSKDKRFEDDLIDMYKDNKDEIIRWKLIRSFQSFESEEIESILLYELHNETNSDKIKNEAARSLERIRDRKKSRITTSST